MVTIDKQYNIYLLLNVIKSESLLLVNTTVNTNMFMAVFAQLGLRIKPTL